MKTNFVPTEFTPVASIVGFAFLGVSFSLLVIIKIYYNSIVNNMKSNGFDLVIFKQIKHIRIGERRIYRNTRASEHNLNLAKGLDLSKLIHNHSTTASMANRFSCNLPEKKIEDIVKKLDVEFNDNTN